MSKSFFTSRKTAKCAACNGDTDLPSNMIVLKEEDQSRNNVSHSFNEKVIRELVGRLH